MATIETDRAERTDQGKRTWRQVRGLLNQMIGRYDEELIDLEVKMKRLDDEVSLGEEVCERLRVKYVNRMYEALEKYHAMWIAHDLMFSLYFEPRSLVKMGFDLEDPEDMENFEEGKYSCSNRGNQ